MRLRSLILGSALLICGCRNAADKNAPANPTTPSASSSAPAPFASAPTVTGASWHWMNPAPQGNGLWAVVANSSCGVVAVGEESTVMRSIDDGLTWRVRQVPDRWRFKSAAIVGTDLYVAGDGPDAGVAVKIGSCGDGAPVVLRTFAVTTDGGVNAVAADSEGRVFVSIVLHSEGKLFCSKPNGVDLKICDDLPNTPFYSMFVDRSGRAFVVGGYGGKDGGIVRASSDHGATWRTIGKNLGNIVYGITGSSDGKTLIASGQGEIHSSVDGGATWTTAPVAMEGGGSMMLGDGDAPYVPNDFDSFVFGADRGTFFVVSAGVLRGEKFQGATLAEPTSTNGGAGFEATATTGNGHWIGVGESGRLTRSIDDGRTWSLVSKDALTKGDQFFDIRSDAKSIFLLRHRMLVRSDDAGVSWSELGAQDLPDPQISTRDDVSFAIDNDVVVVPLPKSGAIARSTDRGKTFAQIPLKLAKNQTVLHVWNGGSGVFYGSGAAGAFFESRDRGATFTSSSIGTIQDLSAGVVSGHDVYVVGNAGASSGGFFHSGDDGKTWVSKGFDFQPFGVVVAGGDLFVADRYGQFFRSSDKGQSWTKTVDLNCGDVSALVAQDTHVFLICGGGRLFTSTDRGTTFRKSPIGADVELLFSDGHAGLYATSSRGFPQLLHYF